MNYKSKTNHLKAQLTDFIEDDIGVDDDDDEDYNILDNSAIQDSNRLKTRLELQNEVSYLKDILNFLNGSNPSYYLKIMSVLDDNMASMLNNLFESSQIL